MKSVKPRFWMIIITILVVVFAGVYVNQNDFMYRQDQTIDELKGERNELVSANSELGRKIEFADTDEFIIREARDKLGLVRPGEVLYESRSE